MKLKLPVLILMFISLPVPATDIAGHWVPAGGDAVVNEVWMRRELFRSRMARMLGMECAQ